MPVKTKVPDLLRRFTPTPLVGRIRAMERAIRLETNSPIVVEHTRRLLGANDEAMSGEADCVWRIVTEAGFGFKPAWPEITAFCDEGLVFINIDQRGFLAADLSAREAVGFMAEEWVNGELGFRGPFLEMLFSITAPTLRLLPASAACVALGQRGLLVFDAPRTGKTTSAYLPGVPGSEFHADQAVFLDADTDSLRAWGKFWPVLSPTSLLPADVVATAQPFRPGSETVLCVDRASRPDGPHRAVVPTYCVFLETHDSQPFRLLPLGRAEFEVRLKRYCLFDGSDPDTLSGLVLNRVQALPAYRLAYNGDHASAAIILRSLLTGQELFERLP